MRSISSWSSSARFSSSASRRSISFSDSSTDDSALCRMRRLPAAVLSLDAALREAVRTLFDPIRTENRPSTIPIVSSALRESSWLRSRSSSSRSFASLFLRVFTRSSYRLRARSWVVSSARSAASRQRSRNSPSASPPSATSLSFSLTSMRRGLRARQVLNSLSAFSNSADSRPGAAAGNSIPTGGSSNVAGISGSCSAPSQSRPPSSPTGTRHTSSSSRYRLRVARCTLRRSRTSRLGVAKPVPSEAYARRTEAAIGGALDEDPGAPLSSTSVACSALSNNGPISARVTGPRR